MTLKALFKKPVDRPIEGVIKADDAASLRLEIEEYVLTNEVSKRLESFLDAYNNYEVANGVWVSGFFGSGKSHLLKMLALLLENRTIDGHKTLDLFLPKCGDNEILIGDLKKAVSIPTKSILFNIDQKADVISKTQVDALLAVFVKVFDESCGYYGKQGHIAKFERDLDGRGLYGKFKDIYQKISGREWHQAREQAILESQNIAKAYAQATGNPEASATGILDKYRSEYKVSIEDFADQVKAYIDRQAPNFRLNFFVDEVGQYIADNVRLMTNLQTIAESFATKCRGRAWVIVTAQEDMSSVVGEMGMKQGNDFSKIQARFANRMKLTSADVAEVIQKRLLMKNGDGIAKLSELYHTQSNNFKTLFDFADGSQAYRNFQDRDHFIHSYPFVPYQFVLFQSAIQNLSLHNAFEGKHSSVGERSMLGVFQQVAIQIGGHKIGQLATFDLMFEGIRTALTAHIQRAITLAEKHLDNKFAVRLLKALFLVKYVEEFKPTVRNLCVLMTDQFVQDMPQLRKTIEEALDLLEQQTYIQRNGEFYEYLTNEEQDVEKEIKNTVVEMTDVAIELEKVIFEYVIKNRKIRYGNNGQDYAYSKKIDDRLQGKEYELAIHVITPFHEKAGDENTLSRNSWGRDELLVLMPPDKQLVRDLLMYKQTEKYIRQKMSISQHETIKHILESKGSKNSALYNEVQKNTQALLGKAKLFVAGSPLDIATGDAFNRLVCGFHSLIDKTYPNLRMLGDFTYTENDIGKFLKLSEEGLFGNDAISLSEAEQEILAFIHGNNRNGVRTTLKSLLERFDRKPYGWYYAAILCILAKLCARGKVELRTDSNQLEDAELERALRNTHGHGNVVLEPQIDFTASQVRRLKDFYAEFFNTPAGAGEAKELGRETENAFKMLLNDLNPLIAQAGQYPFLSALKPVIGAIKEISGKPYVWYLTDLPKQEDTLLDLKEKIIDPVRKFMGGAQKEIFANASLFLQTQEPNFSCVPVEEVAKLRDLLAASDCFKGNCMQQVKSLTDALQARITAEVRDEAGKAGTVVQSLEQRLRGMTEFTALTPEQQSRLTQPFADFTQRIARQKLIAVIRDDLHRFEDGEYQRLLSSLVELSQPAATEPAAAASGTSAVMEAKAEYVACRNLRVKFDKAWLSDEQDVERYLAATRDAMLTEIRNGKRIQI